MNVMTEDQLVDLTRRQMPSAQARELDFLRIPYRRRRDGSLVVAVESVQRVLTPVGATGTLSSSPRFGALPEKSR